MKKISAVVVFFLCSLFSNAQNMTGSWSGSLELQNSQLPLIFHIQKKDSIYKTIMDSPAQGATGIIVDSTSVQDSLITYVIKNIGATYKGQLKNDTLIVGTFTQAGLQFPLDLKKGEIAKEVRKPQEPVPPFPYQNEEVSFTNKNGDTLYGTLAIPSKNDNMFPAVLLITGSGPQNRNAELFGHKPFLVISDYLVRQGIAVLRFDERGVGASQGNFGKATTQDFADDLVSAFAYLSERNEINATQIGLVGHSEGGLVASMMASKNNTIHFVVLLATPGIRGDRVLASQTQKILEKSNIAKANIDTILGINRTTYDLILKNEDPELLKDKLRQHLTGSISQLNVLNPKPEHLSTPQYIQMMVEQLASPWFTFFVKFDPKLCLQAIKCPVLVLQGENDTQVLPDNNLHAIETAFKKGNNKRVEIVRLQRLNHLFQQSQTGLPNEYGMIQETFSPKALQVLGEWIRKQTYK
ncbi:alpha/beta fold hydrolase [Aquimarina sp. U1-2]|uniref:alpha/beta hydrolase family protein n=1 Tax=Aquimarina sp. U1-2 TaxID=2823141 RepID=UPI001AEC9114|nr:alpha/beta fold hydrolase [Aquimarina sp. U1-2]MBP2831179.1 alpha/beta fold hydrolase [Aquimarina sp. U1-2]